MMPAEQHLGHAHALVFLGARVVRTIEQPVDEAVLHGRLRIAQHARQLPHHRIDQRHGGQLPARQNEIAQTDFLVHAAIDETLIDGFVPPAQQHEPGLVRESHDPFVVERRTLRRHHHHTCTAYALGRLRRFRRADRRFERLGQHDHAWTAAIRPVVDGTVIIRREIARIPRPQAESALLRRSARDAPLGDRAEHLGKERDDIELHRALRGVDPAQ